MRCALLATALLACSLGCLAKSVDYNYQDYNYEGGRDAVAPRGLQKLLALASTRGGGGKRDQGVDYGVGKNGDNFFGDLFGGGNKKSGLSDIFKTSGLFKDGILAYTFTAADLPPSNRGYLDTTCRAWTMCMGAFIPALKKLFPNATVELEVNLSDIPQTDISDALEISGRVTGYVIYRARLANGTAVYLFRSNIDVSVSVSVMMDNFVFKYKVTKLTPKISVTDSAIGKVPEEVLQKIFDTAAQTGIISKLNEMGQKGFPLLDLGKMFDSQSV